MSLTANPPQTVCVKFQLAPAAPDASSQNRHVSVFDFTNEDGSPWSPASSPASIPFNTETEYTFQRSTDSDYSQFYFFAVSFWPQQKVGEVLQPIDGSFIKTFDRYSSNGNGEAFFTVGQNTGLFVRTINMVSLGSAKFTVRNCNTSDNDAAVSFQMTVIPWEAASRPDPLLRFTSRDPQIELPKENG